MITGVMSLANMSANGYALIDYAYHFDSRTVHVSEETKQYVTKLVVDQSGLDVEAKKVLIAVTKKLP
jgi:hypothetical protein